MIGWRDATRLDFKTIPKIKYSSEKLYMVGASTVRKDEVLIDAMFDFQQENTDTESKISKLKVFCFML